MTIELTEDELKAFLDHHYSRMLCVGVRQVKIRVIDNRTLDEVPERCIRVTIETE